MEVFRIVRQEYANSLYASGRSNRWNYEGEKVIYTAGSRSLACLENVVHSSGEALQQIFTVMVIYVPDELSIAAIHREDLPQDWHRTARYPSCQQLGSNWYKAQATSILRVPSAIIQQEHNYILNTQHTEYSNIRIIDQKMFSFDPRIKSVTE